MNIQFRRNIDVKSENFQKSITFKLENRNVSVQYNMQFFPVLKYLYIDILQIKLLSNR